MNVAEVVPAFLAACSSIGPAWQQHMDFWGCEAERGHFNDAAW